MLHNYNIKTCPDRTQPEQEQQSNKIPYWLMSQLMPDLVFYCCGNILLISCGRSHTHFRPSGQTYLWYGWRAANIAPPEVNDRDRKAISDSRKFRIPSWKPSPDIQGMFDLRINDRWIT